MKRYLVILMAVLTLAGSASVNAAVSDDEAGEPANVYLKNAALATIIRNYPEWESAELSGKLKMSGLPVTPTVKLYMRNNELLRMSLRAPFLGEVGRVEIDRDSVLLVNKMKHLYCKETVGDLLKSYPGGIYDIQSLLLGRMVFPGVGVLDSVVARQVDFYPTDNGGWMLLPQPSLRPGGVEYGYLAYADGRTAGWIVSTEFSDNDVSAEYTYRNGMEISFEIKKGEKSITPRLEFNEINYNSEGFAPIAIPKSYRRTGIKEFFQNLT